LSRRIYVENFAKPIDPQGRGLFKPPDKLFETRATLEAYAQLASITAYLLDSDPQLLDELIQGIADGQSAASVVQKHATTWQQLQEDWFAWGRMRFAAGTESRPAFDPPAELR
jgi:hypothetical protein